ncbi:MAG: AI-2E family transporter [Putridiphycobacter sp.]|nr:AI-2E family transporter [Putridiphycobacter sp.]
MVQKTAAYFIVLISAITILVVGKSLLIPFILGLLIWFLIVEFRALIIKTPFLGKKLPKWLWTLIASIILFTLFGLAVNVLVDNIALLSKKIPSYEANLIDVSQSVNNSIGFDAFARIRHYAGDFELTKILSPLLNSLTDLFANGFMVVLYVLFLFLEESVFRQKLQQLFTKDHHFEEASEILEKINQSTSRYITLKTIISLITGVASYFALLFIGVDTPIFWAFLIFIMNYIPTIGSLIGTLFPAFIALLQFGNLGHFFAVLSIVGIIQVIVGNFIEPKVMGNTLNLSPLVVIISLSFWGAIWGITGMVLSVPITVILVILFAQFKATKPIAILLSEKGIV